MHQQPLDRALLRQRRQKTAKSGADHGAFSAEIAFRLAEDLQLIRRDFRNILIFGNQGGLKNLLMENYPHAYIVTFDPDRGDVQGDEDLLPFAPHSFDLAVSNLSLHLVNDIPGALAQIRRILKPDGLMNASLLAGESLQELRQSFLLAEAELTGAAASRMIPLPDFTSLPALLQRAGFALPVAHQEYITANARNLFDLLNKIRGDGFANFAKDRARKPLRRDVIARAAEIFQNQYDNNSTAQIAYLSGWSPSDAQQQPLPRGSGKINLADIL